MMRRAVGTAGMALTVLLACGESTGLTDPPPRMDPDPSTESSGSVGVLGTGIAFTSDRRSASGTREIYVIHTDRSVVQVTQGSGWSNAPEWSPDRRRIAFSRGGDIWLAGADGTGLTRVTDDTDGYFEDWDPSWSPDGTRIAFSRDMSGWFEMDIHIVDVDGTDLVRLTHGTGGLGPAWSPDGTVIADGYFDIFLRWVDGTHAVNLTRSEGGHSPAWSPDGTRIAFVSHRDGNAEIYVMGVDGSGLVRLTDDPAYDGAPTWSPDGARIAFATNRDGNGEIYVMNADGSGLANVTRNPAHDWDPTW